jgi:1,4-alpha-glucan branching enzyme
MPLSQEHIAPKTPMGANLTAGGTTFRLWAPNADHVYLVLNPGDRYVANPDDELVKDSASGHWTGFAPGMGEGAQYKFWVVGKGSAGFKRDPYARELTRGDLIGSRCIVRDPNSFPWHDTGFRPPAFSDLIIYQLHIGTFYGVDARGTDTRNTRVATFLDVVLKLEYLAELGINAIEPLPVTEFSGATSLGYNGSDLFSPEMDYSVPPGAELDRYLAEVNRLLAAKRPDAAPFTRAQLEGQVNQLKTMVDLFHVYGIAVLFDVVYNHAGGFEGDDESLFFLDRERPGDNNRSLYFTDQDWAGGLVFAFWKSGVRGFLIDNAKLFLGEYHVDGLRHDEVTVIDSHGGWNFCGDLTDTEHFSKNNAIEIAEYWRDDKTWVVKSPVVRGAGFDSVWNDGLRSSIRATLAQAASGAGADLSLDAIAGALYRGGFAASWRRVEYVESHDEVYLSHDGVRIARLAEPERFALVVWSQPGSRRHGPHSHRQRHSDAVHGPGISRR